MTPNGRYMVVAGKLDPHVTVYSIEKIKEGDRGESTAATTVRRADQLSSTRQGRRSKAAGPGAVAHAVRQQGLRVHLPVPRFGGGTRSLGGVRQTALRTALDARSETPVQYNIGHLCAPRGDTVSPDGNFLISMSGVVGRPVPHRPAPAAELPAARHPQPGTSIPVIYDLPDRRRRAALLPDDQGRQTAVVGGVPGGRMEPARNRSIPTRPQKGSGGVTRDRSNVTVNMTAVQPFRAEHVEVNGATR